MKGLTQASLVNVDRKRRVKPKRAAAAQLAALIRAKAKAVAGSESGERFESGTRLPVAGERHEHVGHTEVHVAVEHEGRDVDAGEGDRQCAESLVEREQPAGRGGAVHDLGRQCEAPDHRHAGEQERNDASRAGDVPPQLFGLEDGLGQRGLGHWGLGEHRGSFQAS